MIATDISDRVLTTRSLYKTTAQAVRECFDVAIEPVWSSTTTFPGGEESPDPGE